MKMLERNSRRMVRVIEQKLLKQPAPKPVDYQCGHFTKAAAPGGGGWASPRLNVIKKAAEDKGTPQQVPGVGDDDHRSRRGHGAEQYRRLPCVLKSRGGRLFIENSFRRPPQGDRQCPCDGRLAVGVSGSGENQPDLRVLVGQM
jgi:hypothetical protein